MGCLLLGYDSDEGLYVCFLSLYYFLEVLGLDVWIVLC